MYLTYKKRFIYIMFSLSIILLSACSSFELTSSKEPQASQGTLNLRNWDFTENGIISLKGEWSFYWEQLLTPQDFNSSVSNKPVRTGLISLPGSWNGYQINEQKLEGKGYASYRLIIETGGIQERLGLKINPMSTAYKLWVNGELLTSNGIVGTNREAMSPQYSTSIVYFTPKEEIIEIVVQNSNFMHRRGGLWDKIELGISEQITDKTTRSLAFEMFITGSLMIMGIYHIGLFALRRNHRSPLYFGIFCLLIGARSLLVGEYYWYKLFPDFSWLAGIKIEYLLTYMSVPTFVMYMQNLYPKHASKRIANGFIILGLVYSIIVVITPASVFTTTLFSYHIIVLIAIVYSVSTLTMAVLHKEKGAVLISFGIIFYALTIANDILFYNEFIRTGDKSILGLFVFVFAQSFVLSMKFSKAYSDVETMSRLLQELNISLEEKVSERTHTLVEYNQYLTSANEELFRMEKSRRHLLSNISHDLRTPMTSIQGYLEAILDRVVIDPERFVSTITA